MNFSIKQNLKKKKNFFFATVLLSHFTAVEGNVHFF